MNSILYEKELLCIRKLTFMQSTNECNILVNGNVYQITYINPYMETFTSQVPNGKNAYVCVCFVLHVDVCVCVSKCECVCLPPSNK